MDNHQEEITITKIQNPFDRVAGRKIFAQPYVPGVTLNEIIVQHAPPSIRARHLSVVRNGVICNDLSAELFPGDSIAIIPRIGDGDCGGTIGQVAVVIATIAAAVLTQGYSLWIQMAITSAVATAGSLIVNGLFPTPTPNFPQISGLSDSSMGLNYGWAGPQTSWTPGLPYPELFGKMRLGGQLINYYIDTNNITSGQTINLLIAMCEGEVEMPVTDASEILINNEIKLDTLEIYDFSTNQGTTDQDCLPGFDQLHQYRDLSIEITTRVSLHLHGDVSPFVDSSPSQKTLTIGADATLDTTNKQFGAGSIAFAPNVSTARIQMDDSDDWCLNRDFSFSCQFRFILQISRTYPVYVHGRFGKRWSLFYERNDDKFYFEVNDDVPHKIEELCFNTETLNLVQGVFYHIEIGKYGENWGIWIDGMQKAWNTSGTPMPAIGDGLDIGGIYDSSAVTWECHAGNLDEIYFQKGKSLHIPGGAGVSNNFTPPTEAYDEESGFTVETKGKADKLTVQIVFPHGLYEINTSAVLIDRSCDFSICYRQKNTATWYLRQGTIGYTGGGGAGISEPDENDVIVGATSGAEGKFASKTIDSGVWADGTAVGDFVLKGVIGTFETSENLNNSTKSENNIATLSATAGNIQHHERVTANSRNPVRRQYLIDCQAGHQNYEVRLKRISVEDIETSKVSNFYWTGLDEILDETLKYPYVSLLGLSVEASEQLQGAIRNVAAVWDRGSIEVKNFSGGGTTLRASSNVAWASMFLLTTREGVDPANIDETSWTAWANWCDDLVDGKPRITCNGVLDSQMSVAAALEKFEQIGRAKIIKTGSKYRVAIEKPFAGIPIQGFSTGNIIEGSFQLEFLDQIDRPDVYNIEFLKEIEEFRKDKVPVYSAEYSSLDRKPKHESIFLWGCTDEDVARRYGLLRMQMSDKLNRFVNFNADVDAIACQVGDVIKVVHDGNKLTFGGRLGNQPGSPWTTIKLDQKIILDAVTYSGNCTIWIQRSSTDTMLERAVTGPWDTETDEITISAAAENIAEDDVWSIARATGELIKYRNTDFARTVETKFRIGALEYNPDVYYHSSYDGGATAI